MFPSSFSVLFFGVIASVSDVQNEVQ